MCKYCETYQGHSLDLQNGESSYRYMDYEEFKGEQLDAEDYFPVNDDVRLFYQPGDYEQASGAIVNGKLRVLVTGDGAGCGDHDINYCPMCGRELRVGR